MNRKDFLKSLSGIAGVGLGFIKRKKKEFIPGKVIKTNQPRIIKAPGKWKVIMNNSIKDTDLEKIKEIWKEMYRNNPGKWMTTAIGYDINIIPVYYSNKGIKI